MKNKLSVISTCAALILAGSLIFAAYTLASQPQETRADWPRYVSIGGSMPEASGTVEAVALARLIEKYLGIPASGEACGGYTAGQALMTKGEMEGECNATSWQLYDAYRGVGFYKKLGRQNVRVISTNVGMDNFCVVRDNSPIKTFTDLKGRRVQGKRPGAATFLKLTKLFLKAHGMTEKDVIIQAWSSFQSAADGLREGTAEAWMGVNVVSTPGTVAAFETIPLRILPLSEEKAAAINKLEPPLTPKWIPGGVLKGQDKFLAMRYQMYNVCRRDLPDSLVYEWTKLIWEHFDELLSIHAVFKVWSLDETLDPKLMFCPFHAGAVKYYKEIGRWTSECEAKQKALLEEMGDPK